MCHSDTFFMENLCIELVSKLCLFHTILFCFHKNFVLTCLELIRSPYSISEVMAYRYKLPIWHYEMIFKHSFFLGLREEFVNNRLPFTP